MSTDDIDSSDCASILSASSSSSNSSSERRDDLDFDGPLIKLSNFYEASRPFNLTGKSFGELPEATRRFLVEMELYPAEFANVKEFFQALLDIRCKRLEKLERTLEGVNRAIVREILASHARMGNHAMDDTSRRVLGEVLQPEWRGHLDQYVEEIDALIWLDMTARAECTPRPTYEQYMRERAETVEGMTEFALRCLQNALDKVKMEERAQSFLEKMTLDGFNEYGHFIDAGHLSDTASVFEEEPWVNISEHK